MLFCRLIVLVIFITNAIALRAEPQEAKMVPESTITYRLTVDMNANFKVAGSGSTLLSAPRYATYRNLNTGGSIIKFVSFPKGWDQNDPTHVNSVSHYQVVDQNFLDSQTEYNTGVDIGSLAVPFKIYKVQRKFVHLL